MNSESGSKGFQGEFDHVIRAALRLGRVACPRSLADIQVETAEEIFKALSGIPNHAFFDYHLSHNAT